MLGRPVSFRRPTALGYKAQLNRAGARSLLTFVCCFRRVLKGTVWSFKRRFVSLFCFGAQRARRLTAPPSLPLLLACRGGSSPAGWHHSDQRRESSRNIEGKEIQSRGARLHFPGGRAFEIASLSHDGIGAEERVERHPPRLPVVHSRGGLREWAPSSTPRRAIERGGQCKWGLRRAFLVLPPVESINDGADPRRAALPTGSPPCGTSSPTGPTATWWRWR